MTGETERFLIVCAAGDERDLTQLRAAVDAATDGDFAVEAHGTAAGVRTRLDALEPTEALVPIVIVADTLPDAAALDLLLDLSRDERFRRTRKVLIAADLAVDDLAPAELRRRAVDAVLPAPWNAGRLRATVDDLVLEFFVEDVDARLVSAEITAAGERAQTATRQLEKLKRSFFGDRAVPDPDAVAAVIKEIDRVLARPERRTFPAGATVLRPGDPVDGVLILERGRVRLTLEIDGREEVFHSRTAGRIIGLFALTLDRPSFFNVVAETDIAVVPVSLEQLDAALQDSPTLAIHFVTVLLRSLAQRALRGIEQHTEINRLNHALASDRDRLAIALERLEQAQAGLIESAKMATLGQLVAGIAHELNNPVAAITRAVDFIQEDLEALAAGHADAARFTAMVKAARQAPPMSTRDERAARRELAAALGDEALARRLVRIGVTTSAEHDRHFGDVDGPGRAARLVDLERHHRVGSSLRNVASAGARIAALVQSLRLYARGGHEFEAGVDLHAALEETLLLLGHDLRDVEIERDYGALPPVTCAPGQLGQVWTNLVANAVQAMEGAGVLRIRTRPVEGGLVHVEVVDSGPGIAPEHLDHIFDMHFTTREKRVDFGLGLGLRIAQDIVHRHGGEICVASRPGRTCFGVTLPVGSAGA